MMLGHYVIFDILKGILSVTGQTPELGIVLLVNKCVIFMATLLADCLQFTSSYSELDSKQRKGKSENIKYYSIQGGEY